MKKLLLINISMLFSLMSFGQKDARIISLLSDTIHVYGKVIYENETIASNALILVRSSVTKKFYDSIRTDSDGHFKLNGISPLCDFWVYAENGNLNFINYGSRYLLLKVPFKKTQLLNNSSTDLLITAKKIKQKEKIKLEQIDKSAFDFYHYESPATYPGGLFKFFNYLKENSIYPQAAIDNAVEGKISIEFTVDKKGNVVNPILTKDIGYGCGKQFIEVLKQSKKWIPAMVDGKHTSASFSIEIPFQLLDEVE